MNCRKCRDQLSAYLDGELAVQQAERIRAHLDTCKACREELEFLKQTIGLVKELPHVPAPPKLRERVLAGLETPQAEDVPREGVSKWRTLWPAAAVLVIGLAIWAFYRPRTPSEPQTVAAKRSMGTRVDQEFSKVPGRHPAGGEGSAPRAQDAIAMRARPETGTPDASPPRKGARIHQAAEVAREGDPRTRVMAKAAFARTETIVIYSEEPPVAYAKALDIVVEKRWQRAPSERRDRSRMASYQHLEWPASITLSLKAEDLEGLKVALADARLIGRATERKAVAAGSGVRKIRGTGLRAKSFAVAGDLEKAGRPALGDVRQRANLAKKEKIVRERIGKAAPRETARAEPAVGKLAEAEGAAASERTLDAPEPLIKVTLIFTKLPEP